MRGFLIDTNVLSELRKKDRCDEGVREWFEGIEPEQVFLSVLVIGEIRQGIERIRRRDEPQARVLEKWVAGVLTDSAERILPVDTRVAERWGRLGIEHPVPIIDALLAATALVHDLAVVTRDEDGFRHTGAQILNPFS